MVSIPFVFVNVVLIASRCFVVGTLFVGWNAVLTKTAKAVKYLYVLIQRAFSRSNYYGAVQF